MRAHQGCDSSRPLSKEHTRAVRSTHDECSLTAFIFMNLISRLAKKTGQTEQEVEKTLTNGCRKYKVFTIPKRKGMGRRVIAQASKDLKLLQRAFIELYPFPLHNCVKSYRPGIGIRDNALPHVNHRFLLKTDLQNFFPSIKPTLFWQELDRNTELPYRDELRNSKHWVEELLFWRPSFHVSGKLVLSIGAPSSPAVSNFCLNSFDEALNTLCKQNNVTYTRYADDLTFSTNEAGKLSFIYQRLKYLLRSEYPSLTLNESKTVFASKRTNRHVTGLVLNNEGNLSLGRQKKRYIKSMLYHAVNRTLNNKDLSWLSGYLNFIAYADSAFLFSLKRKYSPEILQRIQRGGENG